jgi:hypothetical protein
MRARSWIWNNHISKRVNPERIGGEAVGSATNSTLLKFGTVFASAGAQLRLEEVTMKRRISLVTLTAMVLVLLAVGTVYAQSPSKLVANIPFDFHVGQATLPAGTYIVNRPAGLPLHVLKIQNKNNGKGVMTIALPGSIGSSSNQAKLVFNRYGADYFLSEVCSPYDWATHQLPMSKAEKEIARNVGGGKAEVIAQKR